jgi:hypothetical protein
MDDLDRLFVLLVERIRSEYPDSPGQPFEVAELYQSLVPYRHFRRDLGIETNGDYELALIRLLSGERSYLLGEADIQNAMKREVDSKNPNTAAFREFAASRVALPQDAERRAAHIASRAGVSAASPGRDTVLGETPASAAGAAGTSGAAQQATRAPATHSASAAAPPPVPAHAAATEALHSSAPAATREAARAPQPQAAPTAARQSAGASGATNPESGGSSRSATAGSGNRCHYCSGALPAGRSVVYCPHCGQNLTIRRCPACSTELDLSWKFCITCGRSIGAG